ncbi:MAG TPA: hypothetical protein DFR83_06780 [Deltaproteobacteria bacterium]|nr:hypothetical protein [Deltaproteobacteria bacterium]
MVVEMGMNAFGEIALLQDISKPTVRLITNVGAAHLEGVGSLDGVARAKGELFDGARPGDICCVNIDDPRIRDRPLPKGVRVVTYGRSPEAQVRLLSARVDGSTLATRFEIATATATVRGILESPGLHLAHNATAAMAVAVALELDPVQAAERVASYQPVGMRQRLQSGPGSIQVINDAYNANPLSTRVSVETLAAVAGRRRVALLGDMLELGPNEDSLHEEAIAHVLTQGLDLVGTAGPRFARARDRLASAGHAGASAVLSAPDAPALAALISARLAPGDLVLLKGSRGVAMESVLEHIAVPEAPKEG